MIRKAALTSVAVAALVACTTVAEPPASQATVDGYVADAQRMAGEDLKFLMPVCNPQPAVRAAPSAAMDEMLSKLINQPPPEPGQAFDNLYYVGSAWVSAWVLKTSDGLILIDALNNAKEAADLIDGGMRRLGLTLRRSATCSSPTAMATTTVGRRCSPSATVPAWWPARSIGR